MTTETATISDELSEDSLRRLIHKQIDAIHVPGFYPRDVSLKFADRIASHSELDSYKTQYTLKRLGMGYVDVGGDAESAERYHGDALRSIWLIRDMIYPHIHPLDHLRLLLEEVWGAGSHIERIEGRKSFVGTCRVIEPGATMLPHNDRLGRMSEGAADMTGQLAVNIYLEMPESGGDIELWLSEPTPEQDAEIRANDGIRQERIGPPRLLIRPGVGDLVIFNSHLIHSVSPGVGGRRVTISSFIGYRGDDRPLTYWS